MKNNLKKTFLIIFIFLLFKNIVFANEFTFNAENIDITDNGNIIEAKDGTANKKNGQIKIEAKKFQYNKNLAILNAYDGDTYLIEKNIKIKADRFIYDENTSILNAIGNVQIKDQNKNIKINSKNIIYDDINQSIKSTTSSTVHDNLGNIITTSNFIYTLNDGLVKINKAKVVGVDKDVLLVEKAYINLLTKKLIGKDVSIEFSSTNQNSQNQPRLKGNAISSNADESVIKKGVFTMCKKTDNCPPWQFSAKEIKHDKKKKVIYYQDAWLKLYDTPVFYFPKFFHPDPTVKRQSGFLMPAFQDSTNHGTSLQLPYYHVLSDNKDFTLKPRFYSNEKILIQTEYRQVNKSSNHLLDFSVVNEKNKSTKSHLFLNTYKKLNFSNFDESELSLKIEQVTNDTYLKTHKLKSPIIKNYDSLKSKVGIEAYRDNLSLNVDFEVYENLGKNKSDRYEYILPNYTLIRQFEPEEVLNGNLSLNSSGFIKNYNTNITEKIVINDFIYSSYPEFTKNGFKNNYNYIIKNVNSESKNSKTYKDELDHTMATTIEYNSSYPLKKIVNNYNNILKPKISLRYSPNNSKNMRNENRRIDTNNIFSLNRIGVNDGVEGGASLTYGIEFLKTNIQEREIFTAKIANVFKPEYDKKLPTSTSLGEKTSDIFGSIGFSPNEIWSIGYDFAEENNFSDTSYEILKTQIKINNLVTSFEYLNENNTTEKESFLSNKSFYQLDEANNIGFETRKNKKTKLTEFYNLVYQYRNDCLVASIEYNKDYYSDRDLKPSENIFLKLTIIPFGQTSSPNLK